MEEVPLSIIPCAGHDIALTAISAYGLFDYANIREEVATTEMNLRSTINFDAVDATPLQVTFHRSTRLHLSSPHFFSLH